MAASRQDPKTLDDVIFVTGLPQNLAYGADHSPVFDEAKAEEIYAAANETLSTLLSTRSGVQLLAALGAIQSATALLPPPQEVGTASVELAQAMVLQHPGPPGPVTPADVSSLTSALETHTHLFLGRTANGKEDPKRDLLKRRMIETLMVRHTSYPHHATLIVRRIARELGGFGEAIMGVSFVDAVKIAEASSISVISKLRLTNTPDEIKRWLAGEAVDFEGSWVEAFRVDTAVVSATHVAPRWKLCLPRRSHRSFQALRC